MSKRREELPAAAGAGAGGVSGRGSGAAGGGGRRGGEHREEVALEEEEGYLPADDGGLESVLHRLYRSQRTIPRFIDDPDIEEQDIERFYVTLQMVLDKDKREEEEKDRRDPGSRPADYEVVAGQKISIKVEDIFVAKDNQPQASRVLLLGAAGVGKTTLMHYISYKWSKGELFRDKFDYVFRVRLRYLTNDWHDNYTPHERRGRELASFIHYCLSEHDEHGVSIDAIQELISSRSDRVLLLLDGYDEIAHLVNKGTPKRIINKVFRAPNIIMTSRPNAVDASMKERFDRRIENIGLDEEGIERYIDTQFGEERSGRAGDGGTDAVSGRELKEFLKTNAMMRDVCRTPVNLAMVCLIWRDPELRESLSNDYLLSDLYSGMMLWLGKRYIAKFRNDGEEDIDLVNITLRDLEELPEIRVLEELAFEGFREERLAIDLDPGLIRRIVDRHRIEIRDIHRVGLLKADTKDRRVIDSRHEFIHLTFQEYLVAQHLRRGLESEDESIRAEAASFIMEYKYHPRFLTTMRFLSGLASSSTVEVEERFWEVITINGPYSIELGNIELFRLTLQLLPQTRPRDEGVVITRKEELIDFVANLINSNIEKYSEYFERGRYPDRLLQPIITLLQNHFVAWSVKSRVVELLGRIGGEAAIPYLVAVLQDQSMDSHIRGRAAASLGRIGSEAALGALVEVMRDQSKDWVARYGAADALCRIGGEAAKTAIPYLVELSRDQSEDGYVRRSAAEALGRIGGEAAVSALVEVMRDQSVDSVVRVGAVWPLMEIGGEVAKTAIPHLVELLRDQSANRTTRGEAAEALVEIGGEAAVSALVEVMRDQDEDSYARRKAAEVLAEIGGEAAKTVIPCLVEVMRDQDEDSYARRKAADALCRIGGEASVSALVEVLPDRSVCEDVRKSAAIYLGKIGGEAAKTVIPHLVEVMWDQSVDSVVRVEAAYSLGEIGGEAAEAVPHLVKRLRDHPMHSVVRSRATEALGEIGGEVAVSALVEVLWTFVDSFVRRAAAEALGRIGREFAERGLVEVMQDQSVDSYVRSRAADALGEIGGEAAVSALVEVLRDQSADILFRYSAAEALEIIGGEAVESALVEVLRDQSADVFGRYVASRALDRIEELAVSTLDTILRDNFSYMNLSLMVRDAYSSLGEIEREAAVPHLVEVLHDQSADRYFRRNAAEALGAIGGEVAEAAVPALVEVLRDRSVDEDIRMEAAQALGEIEREEAVPHLVEVMQDHSADDIVRLRAAEALGRIGGEEAVSALVAILQDQFMDSYVVRQVLNALTNNNKLLPQIFESASASKDNTSSFYVLAEGLLSGAITFIIGSDYLLFRGDRYSIRGSEQERLEHAEAIYDAIEDRFREAEEVVPRLHFFNRGIALPHSSLDISEVRSIVNPNAVLTYDIWLLSTIHEGSADNLSIILERRSLFGDRIIYKLGSDFKVYSGFPIIEPADADHATEVSREQELRSRVFGIDIDNDNYFYVSSFGVNKEGVRFLLDTGEINDLLAAIPEEQTPLPLVRLFAQDLPWVEYIASEDVQHLRSYQLLGEAEPPSEQVRRAIAEFREFTTSFVTREEVSEAIEENDYRAQIRLGREYIRREPKLNEYYRLFSSTLYEAFIAASAIHSGMVDNARLSSAQDRVTQITSVATSIIDHIAGPIPIVGQVSRAVTAVLQKVVEIREGNAINRLLSLLPERTMINEDIERVSIIMTLAFRDRIRSLVEEERGVVGNIKKWGEELVGIENDLDSIYKREGFAHASYIIKAAMGGEAGITHEELISIGIVQRFDPGLLIVDIERDIDAIVADMRAGRSAQPLSLAPTSAGAGGVLMPGVAYAVPDAEDIRRVIESSTIPYHTALDVIKRVAELHDNYKLKRDPGRLGWIRGYISIKDELLGHYAGTEPANINGNVVLRVLDHHGLSGDLALIARELNIDMSSLTVNGDMQSNSPGIAVAGAGDPAATYQSYGFRSADRGEEGGATAVAGAGGTGGNGYIVGNARVGEYNNLLLNYALGVELVKRGAAGIYLADSLGLNREVAEKLLELAEARGSKVVVDSLFALLSDRSGVQLLNQAFAKQGASGVVLILQLSADGYAEQLGGGAKLQGAEAILDLLFNVGNIAQAEHYQMPLLEGKASGEDGTIFDLGGDERSDSEVNNYIPLTNSPNDNSVITPLLIIGATIVKLVESKEAFRYIFSEVIPINIDISVNINFIIGRDDADNIMEHQQEQQESNQLPLPQASSSVSDFISEQGPWIGLHLVGGMAISFSFSSEQVGLAEKILAPVISSSSYASRHLYHSHVKHKLLGEEYANSCMMNILADSAFGAMTSLPYSVMTGSPAPMIYGSLQAAAISGIVCMSSSHPNDEESNYISSTVANLFTAGSVVYSYQQGALTLKFATAREAIYSISKIATTASIASLVHRATKATTDAAYHWWYGDYISENNSIEDPQINLVGEAEF